ncbi:MAG: hypothetical protein IBX64_13910 [Actinobacteria bacterium]|nr:hypothetical protein [Actinomycetota bacterium]
MSIPILVRCGSIYKQPGNAAEGRIDALKDMLAVVGDLINEGNYEDALGRLEAILKHFSGNPADFVSGTDRQELEDQINSLIQLVESKMAI